MPSSTHSHSVNSHRAELRVVHAVPPKQPFNWHARERGALMAKLRQRAEHARVEFTDRVQQGDAAKIILLHARSLRADVIVLGTHQRSGIDRLRVGSVGARVAAKATAPVLLVPEGGHLPTIKPFRHVAVAVDFSGASNRAIEQAFALATDPADRVTLVHIVPGFSAGVPPHLYRYGVVEYQEQVIADARHRLQRVVSAKPHSTAAIHTRVVVGDTTTAISEVVDSIGADLLVVGVPKRGVVSRALFGRTAARLLNATSVPMLAVPDRGTAIAHDERTDNRVAA